MADDTRRPRSAPLAWRGARARSVRFRMLGAVALAGSAALVVGCASPSAPGGPTSPPVAVAGADPVPLDDARLPSLDAFESGQAEGVLVRWATPGESVAVVVGGSGGGGECIIQPTGSGVDPVDESIVLRFEPPSPEVVCTADFRLHGFELALGQAVDASAVHTVRLANLDGENGVIETRLGPDDLLEAGATPDPQPSAIPGDGTAPAPEPIPAADLPDASAAQDDPAGGLLEGEELAVYWLTPGTEIAVLLGDSGTADCVPTPVSATASGPGRIEVRFDPAAGQTCTDDFVRYAWRFTLAEPTSATLPVTVAVAGTSDAGQTVEVMLEPDRTLELG